MTDRLRIEVYRKSEQRFFGDFGGTVLIGRQTNPAEPLFFSHAGEGGATRLAIAAGDQSTISRLHLRLQRRTGDRVRADNRGKNVVVVIDHGPLAPGEATEVDLPATFVLGEMAVRVKLCPLPVEHDEFLSLDQPTRIPSRAAEALALGSPVKLTRTVVQDASKAPSVNEVPRPDMPTTAFSLEASEGAIGWLQTVIGVLQSAANSSDFFTRSATAIVNLVGLDTGCALLLKNDDWEIAARFQSPQTGERKNFRPSLRILQRMRQEKRTFRDRPALAADCALPRSGASMNSLAEIEAVVVSPLLDANGDVIGALYGERRLGGEHGDPRAISRLEAMIVETLACGVAAGLARQEQQKKVLAARVQFEQFFTPELSRQLELEPDLLNGREADVSILFCDIRGFSRISHKIGPKRTLDFIHDVMNRLSEVVVGCRGVLVDYIGDELMAMWGAPQAQPDHADLACQAAIEMIRLIPQINAHWQAEIEEPFDLGIGVNSGRARVGNTGSDRKFKYGPLGVNRQSGQSGARLDEISLLANHHYLSHAPTLKPATRGEATLPCAGGQHPRRRRIVRAPPAYGRCLELDLPAISSEPEPFRAAAIPPGRGHAGADSQRASRRRTIAAAAVAIGQSTCTLRSKIRRCLDAARQINGARRYGCLRESILRPIAGRQMMLNRPLWAAAVAASLELRLRRC